MWTEVHIFFCNINEERDVALGKQHPSAILMGNSIQLNLDVVIKTTLRRNYIVKEVGCQVPL